MPIAIHTIKRSRLNLATLAEVADYMHVAEVTIRRRIKQGAIPATRAGRDYRIRWDDVDAYLARQTVAPTAVR